MSDQFTTEEAHRVVTRGLSASTGRGDKKNSADTVIEVIRSHTRRKSTSGSRAKVPTVELPPNYYLAHFHAPTLSTKTAVKNNVETVVEWRIWRCRYCVVGEVRGQKCDGRNHKKHMDGCANFRKFVRENWPNYQEVTYSPPPRVNSATVKPAVLVKNGQGDYVPQSAPPLSVHTPAPQASENAATSTAGNQLLPLTIATTATPPTNLFRTPAPMTPPTGNASQITIGIDPPPPPHPSPATVTSTRLPLTHSPPTNLMATRSSSTATTPRTRQLLCVTTPVSPSSSVFTASSTPPLTTKAQPQCHDKSPTSPPPATPHHHSGNHTISKDSLPEQLIQATRTGSVPQFQMTPSVAPGLSSGNQFVCPVSFTKPEPETTPLEWSSPLLSVKSRSKPLTSQRIDTSLTSYATATPVTSPPTATPLPMASPQALVDLILQLQTEIKYLKGELFKQKEQVASLEERVAEFSDQPQKLDVEMLSPNSTLSDGRGQEQGAPQELLTVAPYDSPQGNIADHQTPDDSTQVPPSENGLTIEDLTLLDIYRGEMVRILWETVTQQESEITNLKAEAYQKDNVLLFLIDENNTRKAEAAAILKLNAVDTLAAVLENLVKLGEGVDDAGTQTLESSSVDISEDTSALNTTYYPQDTEEEQCEDSSEIECEEIKISSDDSEDKFIEAIRSGVDIPFEEAQNFGAPGGGFLHQPASDSSFGF